MRNRFLSDHPCPFHHGENLLFVFVTRTRTTNEVGRGLRELNKTTTPTCESCNDDLADHEEPVEVEDDERGESCDPEQAGPFQFQVQIWREVNLGIRPGYRDPAKK